MTVTTVIAKFPVVARLVQPHEVISLQTFGIGGSESNRGTSRPSQMQSIPFRSLEEDQDTATVLGSRHLLDSVNA